jgi:uncharacterized protein VirK/YbjX
MEPTMIFANLTKHWAARRRQYSLASWFLCIVRSLRVLAFYGEHQALCRLDVVRNYVAVPSNDDLFHHLSHRDYLVKNFSARERVRCVLTHYRFEDATFSRAYKQAVYLAGGLTLWHRSANGSSFSITLAMAPRMNAEGDLILIFLADGKCLHRLGFSWIEGSVAGVASPVVPFLARNQGRWTDSDDAFAAFEKAFPHNSPSFFCFAAMQGLAQAVNMPQVVGIKSACHVAFDPAAVKHFANAYDGFWKIVGGIELPGSGHLIALPFYVKPLAEMAGKHRKRAAGRRAYWREISESAHMIMQGSLRHGPGQRIRIEAPLRELAEGPTTVS